MLFLVVLAAAIYPCPGNSVSLNWEAVLKDFTVAEAFDMLSGEEYALCQQRLNAISTRRKRIDQERRMALELLRKRWQKGIDDLDEILTERRRNEEGLGSLVVSELQFSESDKQEGPGVDFLLTNRSDKVITRVELEAELLTPGRTIPWAKDVEIAWNISGGLNPGESRRCHLRSGKEKNGDPRTPSGDFIFSLSPWWSMPVAANNVIQPNIRLTAAYGESYDMFEAPDAGNDAPVWFVDYDDKSGREIKDYQEALRRCIATAERLLVELDSANEEEAKSDDQES